MPYFRLPDQYSYKLKAEIPIESSLYKFEDNTLHKAYRITFHPEIPFQYTEIASCTMHLVETPEDTDHKVTFYLVDLTFRADVGLTNKEKHAILDAIHGWTQEIMLSNDPSDCYLKFETIYCAPLCMGNTDATEMLLWDAGYAAMTAMMTAMQDQNMLIYTREHFLDGWTPSRKEPMPLWQ